MVNEREKNLKEIEKLNILGLSHDYEDDFLYKDCRLIVISHPYHFECRIIDYENEFEPYGNGKGKSYIDALVSSCKLVDQEKELYENL